jgi:hypothetical protein
MDVNYKKYNIVITHQKLKKQFMLMYDIYIYIVISHWKIKNNECEL